MASTQKVSIAEAMAEIQALDKPDWINSCSQLAEHFIMYVFEKYNDCDELRIVIDRLLIYRLNIFYTSQKSATLKTATRVSRQGGQDPMYYKISDTTHIANVPMKRLLSQVVDNVGNYPRYCLGRPRWA